MPYNRTMKSYRISDQAYNGLCTLLHGHACTHYPNHKRGLSVFLNTLPFVVQMTDNRPSYIDRHSDLHLATIKGFNTGNWLTHTGIHAGPEYVRRDRQLDLTERALLAYANHATELGIVTPGMTPASQTAFLLECIGQGVVQCRQIRLNPEV